jgi:hypothetical protein
MGENIHQVSKHLMKNIWPRNLAKHLAETFDEEHLAKHLANKSIKCVFFVYVYEMSTNNNINETNIPHYS